MNGGHGHVVPRVDGAQARCGGPALCDDCAREAEAREDHRRKTLRAADWNPTEAIYAFAAWLTIRHERLTVGFDCDAAQVATLVGDFMRRHELPAPENGWELGVIPEPSTRTAAFSLTMSMADFLAASRRDPAAARLFIQLCDRTDTRRVLTDALESHGLA